MRRAATLAIGIGPNTAVFAVLNGVLLKPLPYLDSDALVVVWNRAPGAPGITDVSGGLRLSLSMYVTYAGTAAVTGLREPEQVRAVFVTDGTLQVTRRPTASARQLADSLGAIDDMAWGEAEARRWWNEHYPRQTSASDAILP